MHRDDECPRCRHWKHTDRRCDYSWCSCALHWSSRVPSRIGSEDAPGGPTENTMTALDETINLVLQWMGHPALEVAGFKEGRIPVDVRQAWRNDFRLALIALNRLKGETDGRREP